MADTTWQIGMSAFNKLWFDAYSRIVGHMWHLEEIHDISASVYGNAFKTNEAFRRKQFEKLGVEFDADIPIYYDDVPSDASHRREDVDEILRTRSDEEYPVNTLFLADQHRTSILQQGSTPRRRAEITCLRGGTTTPSSYIHPTQEDALPQHG